MNSNSRDPLLLVMTIIALCGKMGSGKDYIAHTYIVPYITARLKQTCLQWSFADQIKVNVMAKHDVSFQDVFLNKTDASRRLLQHEGTENGRDVQGQDVWIRYFDNWTKLLSTRGIQNIVTCDVRFKNEVEYVKSNNGVVIKVVAPARNAERLSNESKGNLSLRKSLQTHSSETDLDDMSEDQLDFVIHNDPGDELDVAALYTCIRRRLIL